MVREFYVWNFRANDTHGLLSAIFSFVDLGSEKWSQGQMAKNILRGKTCTALI